MDHPKQAFLNRVEALGLPETVHSDYESIYQPVVDWIMSQHIAGKTYVLGVNGAQGSGKSTFCSILKDILVTKGLATVVLSIDDLYHTRSTRQALAEAVHPLCAIRGVPGTHDLTMGIALLKRLKTRDSAQVTALPRFDKAADDRCKEDDFERVSGPIDIVLFEGWCVGEPPIEPYDGPWNEREARDDAKGVWAQWSERALNSEYQILNEILDALIMIKVPSMTVVRESRWLQEQKLHEKVAQAGPSQPQPGLMTKSEVMDYVALFERHTEHMFDSLVKSADLLIERDDNFNYRLARK